VTGCVEDIVSVQAVAAADVCTSPAR